MATYIDFEYGGENITKIGNSSKASSWTGYWSIAEMNEQLAAKIPKYSNKESFFFSVYAKENSGTFNSDVDIFFSNSSGTSLLNVFSKDDCIYDSGYTGLDVSKVANCVTDRQIVYNNGSESARFIGIKLKRTTSLGTTRTWSAYYVINAAYIAPTYTISTVAGTGGTVSGSGTFDVTVADQTKTITATPNSGYRFVKWVDSDGNTYTSASVDVTISQNNISAFETTKTYTAYFERIPYTVTYNGNGATSGSMESQTAIVGDDLTLNARSFNKFCTVTFEPNYSGGSSVFTNAAATFKGWEDHGTITASNGETFTYEQFDAPFYANTYGDLYNAFAYNKLSLVNHWVNNGKSEGRQCINSNGVRGVYPDKAVVNSLADGGGSTSLYAQWGAFSAVTLRTPTRDGYKLKGWYTSASGGTKVGDGGDSYVPTGDITLYAQWEVAKIFIGTSQPSKIYLGTQEVKEVYVGTTKVYG